LPPIPWRTEAVRPHSDTERDVGTIRIVILRIIEAPTRFFISHSSASAQQRLGEGDSQFNWINVVKERHCEPHFKSEYRKEHPS
jgi:hypothetical protein